LYSDIQNLLVSASAIRHCAVDALQLYLDLTYFYFKIRASAF
jgi:hypothetical protein